MENLGNHVRIGTVRETQDTMFAMYQHFYNVCEWVTKNRPRTEINLTLYSILSASPAYLKVAAQNIGNHVSVLALATRSLYELDLRVRHILASPENMNAWQSEAVEDKIQVLQGILGIETTKENEQQRAILRTEIDRLKSLRTKHKLPELKRIPTISSIAKSCGMSDEHAALFKMFSKLVHPSSYLVNDYSNATSPQVFAILSIHLQLYAWDLFSRICDALEVPETARSFSNNRKTDDA